MKKDKSKRVGLCGFTLLEILVALSILAVALGAILQSFSSGLRSLGAAETHALALMHARSQLAKVGSLIPLEFGEQTGGAGEFEWTVSVRLFESQEEDPVLGAALVPYQLDVTVTWPGGGQVELTTIRVGPAT